MSVKSKLRTAAVSTAAVAAIGAGTAFAAAAPASGATKAPASTVGCNSLSASNGTCGSVALRYGHFSLDVYQQHATSGNKVILWTKSNSDPAQDFYAAQYNQTLNQFTAEYAPNGIRSGYCVSFPSTTLGSKAVLRPCNEGPWQTFSVTHPSSGYFEIKNQASGLVMEDRGYGNQGTQLDQWSANGGDNQLWRPFS
jgi:hypothetical protein